MKAEARRYAVRLGSAITVYAVVLVVALAVVHDHPTAHWRYAVVLLPMVPLLTVPWSVLAFLRSMDELERRIQLEALGFAFVATALSTFAYGLLQTVGLPDVNWMFVWPVLATFWCVGLLLARWRYA